MTATLLPASSDSRSGRVGTPVLILIVIVMLGLIGFAASGLNATPDQMTVTKEVAL